ncbi:MAG: ATP-dependent zinc metalloprotease FtsH [Planctomycetota bacterium]
MSDRRPDQNQDLEPRDHRPQDARGSGVWFVLIAVILLVLFSALLYRTTSKDLRYPDLTRLLKEHVKLKDQVPGPDAKKPAIIVPSPDDSDVQLEYSDLQMVLLGDEEITGSVMFRSLGKGGKNAAKKDNVPQKVAFRTVRVRNESRDAKIDLLLDEAGVLWDTDRPNRWLADHWIQLVMLGAIIAIGIVMLRRIGGVGSPMSFSRSRGKLHGQEELSISFEDAAGIDEAVEEVREVVDFLKNSEKYQALGGRIPKGVLLVGPPGTGKTLLAKAIAGEAGVPFFSLSGSDFVEMFVGVGAARVRDMFQQATSRAPCIIFIDELDALGKSRSGSVVGGHDEREQTLNALLVEMDGFDSNNGVIVIAATNRPETLDPALLRPGRFDRQVLVDRPDVAGREAILKVHVRSVKLGEDVDLRHIASITSGFVGADLANLVNEAALLAARADKTAVGTLEFDEAVDRVTAGLEKKSRVMNEDEKIRVAYHEAAHALVAAALPNTDPVHKVSIIPRGFAALGYTMQRPESERYLMTKYELESRMKVLLAGTLAEEMVLRDISTGAQNDLERCTEIARSMVMDYGMSRLGRINYRRSTSSPFLAGGGGQGHSISFGEETAKMIDKEVSRIVEDALVQTKEILTQRREVLEAITQRLLEVEAIDNGELMRLIEENWTGLWLVPGTVAEKPRAKIRKAENDLDTLKEAE